MAVVSNVNGIYMVDYGVVRRFQEDAGTLTTIAGRIDNPMGRASDCSLSGGFVPAFNGIALSDHGTFYVSTPVGYICEMDQDGGITPAATLTGGIDAIASLGKIATVSGGTVTELDSSFNVLRVTDAGPLQKWTTAGLAVDLDGGVWVSGREVIGGVQDAVVETVGGGGLAMASQSPSSWPSGCTPGSVFCVPTALAQVPFDGVLVADYGLGTIAHLSASGSTSIVAGVSGVVDVTSGPARLAHLGRPVAVWRDVFGNVFFLEGANGLLRKISAAGDVSTLAGTLSGAGKVDGPGIAARFTQPTAVAVGPAGEIWVAEYEGRIVRITAEGIARTITTLPCIPDHLAVAAAGELMVACSDSTIRGVTTAGAVRVVAGGSGSGYSNGPVATSQFGQFAVSSPQTTQGAAGGALAFDGVDTLYVADAKNSAVRAIKAGTVSTFATPGGAPDGVAVTDGRVFVLVDSAHVLSYSSAGVLQADTGLGGALHEASIAAAADGSMYVTDPIGNRLLRLDSGGAITTAAGSTRTLALIPGPLPASLSSPVSVAVSPPGAPNAGTIFFATIGDNAVGMLRR